MVSSLHSEAWHSRLVFTVKFGGCKLGGLRSSLVVAVVICEWLVWLVAVQEAVRWQSETRVVDSERLQRGWPCEAIV